MNAIVKCEGRELTFLDVDPASHIGNCLLNVCLYEEPNLKIIQSLGIEGNYCDVGAHIGTHALYFSLFCPSKTVYAFEPHPPYFANLIRNIEVNNAKNVTSFNAALVAKDNDFLPTNEGWEYRAMSLDFFQLQDIKVLKIDVESSELAVLQGAKETLKQVEHVFLEVWPEVTCKDRNVEYPMEAITEFLAPYGLKYKQAMPWEDLHWWAKGKVRFKTEKQAAHAVQEEMCRQSV